MMIIISLVITDLAISSVITTIGNEPKKFDFVRQTVSHLEAGHETKEGSGHAAADKLLLRSVIIEHCS